MTGRQRNLLIGLAAANLVVFSAAGALLLSADVQPQPTPARLPGNAAACRGSAASGMAEHGIAGTVTIRSGGSIAFELSGADPTQAWDAFAIAAELLDHGCGPYDPIRVDVPDPSLAPNQRLLVEARWVDVQAWSLGRIDDQTLSDRTTRSTYRQNRLRAP